MKNLLFLAFVIPSFIYAQKFENDTLITSTGYKIYKGAEITIGRGSQDDGLFTYIQKNQSGFGTIITATNNSKYNREQFSLAKNFAGAKAEVITFVKRASIIKPLVTIKKGSGRYEIDMEPAIAKGEIEVPEEFKKADKAEAKPQLSVADELKKLKELLDSGAITQEEYDAQKKKILNK